MVRKLVNCKPKLVKLKWGRKKKKRDVLTRYLKIAILEPQGNTHLDPSIDNVSPTFFIIVI